MIDDNLAHFSTNGYAVVRGVFAPEELAEPMAALTAWHDRRTNDPLSISVHEQAPEAYERSFWRPIGARLRRLARELLGREPLEIGRQLIGSRSDPEGAEPHFDAHIDSLH